jgi:type IX secretion system PorP/SprF family membrane protein
MKTSLFHIALLLLLALPASGQQDPMYSQYMFNRLVINPAYAGAREQLSVAALARAQWLDFDGGPRTQTISLHTPTTDQRHGIGLVFTNDRTGYTSNTLVTFNYAYRIPAGKTGTLALGLNMGLNSYWARLSQVATWDPGDVAFGSGSDIQKWQFVAGPGIYYQSDHLYLGASAPNIIPHRLYDPFYEQLEASDRIHYMFMGGAMLRLSRHVEFRPSFTMRATPSAPLSLDLSGALLLNEMVWLGVSWRPNNAWVFMTEVYLTRMLRLGYAYDFANSAARSYFGDSHELMLGIDLGFGKTRIVSPKLF